MGWCNRIMVFKKQQLQGMGYFLLFLPFLLPNGLVSISNMLSSLRTIGMWISTLLTVFYFVIYIYKRKIENIPLFYRPLILFGILMIYTTIENKGDLNSAIYFVRNLVIVSILTQLFISIENRYVIKYLANYILLVAILNDLFMILGIDFGRMISYVESTDIINYSQVNNLISNDNSLLPYLIPGLAIILIYTEIYQKNLLFKIICTVICLFSMIYSWSGTAVGIIIILFFFVFTPLRDKISYPMIIVISIVENILFVGLRVQEMFSWFITKILGKSMNFTNRTLLWDQAIARIMQTPFLGSGKLTSDLLFQTDVYSSRFTAHNMYLQVGIWAGIIGMILFIMIFVFAGITLDKGECGNCKIWEKYSILALLMYFTMEVHTAFPMAMILLVFMQYPSKLANMKRTYLGSRI